VRRKILANAHALAQASGLPKVSRLPGNSAVELAEPNVSVWTVAEPSYTWYDFLHPMNRAYYSDTIAAFLETGADEILGQLVRRASADGNSIESTQTDAWLGQISILKTAIAPYRERGSLYFEYSIPRLGRRIDVLALIGPVIFIFEFKVGEREFTSSALDQVCDYALDLKNFHEGSHAPPIAPIVIATRAESAPTLLAYTPHGDGVMLPIRSIPASLSEVIQRVLDFAGGTAIEAKVWEAGRYHPTPTIIEAATALYRGHKVEEISKKDAGAENLAVTSKTIDEIISASKANSSKSICFVTGVPGAGKTLVGLDIATKHYDKQSELYSVFLSGNGPLVAVLREALAIDKVDRQKKRNERIRIVTARSEVKVFIQNVHHFRKECLDDVSRPPIEHVAIFDEAQRAWNLEQTAKFMAKRGHPNFAMSEPAFLISCLDRHADWAVVVCLVGGGQEINTGEAGISEWIDALGKSFPNWHLHISPRLTDSEYGAGKVLEQCKFLPNVKFQDRLHLGVSMRSFRAEKVSLLVKQLLDLEESEAAQTLAELRDRYPIFLTRDLAKAKLWLREKARGNERYGLVASSNAYRLKPHAVDVRLQVDPVQWFLYGKEDVRSSYYLEDAATEYRVQGLELDWACVTWDADFRRVPDGWGHWKFVGDRWNRVHRPERQRYLKNAYRVLLTRARQGMVIVVPDGEASDHTRKREFYDTTFEYLAAIGFLVL
jgi:hypothetical protein